MVVHETCPLTDHRWGQFVRKSSHSSVFHTNGWLEALHRTYGYKPVVFTTSPPHAPIENGLVFCHVQSALTGTRLVSLPFSDHCEPLLSSPEDIHPLRSAIEQEIAAKKMKYLEIRPKTPLPCSSSLLFPSSHSYYLHEIDLEPRLDELFRNCHKSSTQRKIRRADREGLTYKEGRSEQLIDDFFNLFLLTRRRHKAPPPPKRWFWNLANCLGESVRIRVAYKDGEASAAILTIQHKDSLVYKYGASDPRFHHLGSMHLLFWQSIEEAKRAGLRRFDLGRTDTDNQGLLAFKEHWGSTRSTLTYLRYSTSKRGGYAPSEAWRERMSRRVFSLLPNRLFQAAGALLYRHIG